MEIVRRVMACVFCVLVTVSASAQVQVGAIAGIVTDSSNAILPGVNVSLSGEKLIGGVQSAVTDSTGAFRFDRLPPGTYNLKIELQGFKTVERTDIRVDAAFVATVNAKLEVGSVSESITVTGESPTVDTKSNVQQTVMNQDILEGVPSGRDPWSVAKIIPGMSVSTYDVGGTQSIQQSSLAAHGSSTNDVSYNIDGATVNWPGGGGGATMLYYDQGMFEEVNYMTSAIPAEVMAGGVSINMVTKDAGNKWRGDGRYTFSSGCLTPQNPTPGCLESNNIPNQAGLLGNPTQTTWDLNFAGGGALIHDKLWVNGAIRRWIVNKLVNAKNDDGTQAIDDNTLKNYSGKGVYSIDQNQKFQVSYNWNNKIRGHRRNTPPDLVPDIASLVQTNPASTTQAKYTGIRNKLVVESAFSWMNGETDYNYQPNTPANAVRLVDNTLDSARNAAQDQEYQPNSRIQWDNSVSYTKTGWGGDHLIKGGVQFARLYFDDQFSVLNNMYLVYNNNVPTSVQLWNTPTEAKNVEHVLGFYVQDSWTIGNKLTLNLGGRFDHNTGILPAQSTPGGPYVAAQTLPESTPIKQNIGVWRTGLVFDPLADGKTALKASYSRYGLQVGIDRVTNVNPFSSASETCPWNGQLNPDGTAAAAGISFAKCTGFQTSNVHYAGPNGPSWPYSDEITAGVEREVITDMRVGVMYYHRTNRNQIGVRNLAVPSSAYTPAAVNVPNGPNGATTSTVYNLNPAYLGLQNNVYDNQPYLDTTYNGVEVTASKRLSKRWQMVAGFTAGKNTGGLSTGGVSGGGSPTNQGNQLGSSNADLNDPNNTAIFTNGVIGFDSTYAFRMSGSYDLPGHVLFAGTLIANTGYPYFSQFSVTQKLLPTLTRSSQFIPLSDRGDERLPAVTQLDLRVSRAFNLGQGRKIVPQVDIFNVTNANTTQSLVNTVGSTYNSITAFIPPRIIRIGVTANF